MIFWDNKSLDDSMTLANGVNDYKDLIQESIIQISKLTIRTVIVLVFSAIVFLAPIVLYFCFENPSLKEITGLFCVSLSGIAGFIGAFLLFYFELKTIRRILNIK